MASSMRLISSKLVTRSLIPSSRFHGIHTRHRSYSTMPIIDHVADIFDQSWVKNLYPQISSVKIKVSMLDSDEDMYLKLNLPHGSVGLNIPGLELDDLKACDNHHTKVNYLAGINLPDNCKTSSDIIEEMKDGSLKKVTVPNEAEFKTDIMANIIANIFASFHDITVKRSWPYYDMFSDRSILGERFCPVLRMLSPINSFSIYKKETFCGGLEIDISMPGREEMKFTMQGLRVSLHMCEPYENNHHSRPELLEVPERKDIKTYFDYDTFFIEGKTKEEHHITGIHLPKGIQKKHNMIRREMKNNIFYAFLPCVKKEEINMN